MKLARKASCAFREEPQGGAGCILAFPLRMPRVQPASAGLLQPLSRGPPAGKASPANTSLNRPPASLAPISACLLFLCSLVLWSFHLSVLSSFLPSFVSYHYRNTFLHLFSLFPQQSICPGDQGWCLFLTVPPTTVPRRHSANTWWINDFFLNFTLSAHSHSIHPSISILKPRHCWRQKWFPTSSSYSHKEQHSTKKAEEVQSRCPKSSVCPSALHLEPHLIAQQLHVFWRSGSDSWNLPTPCSSQKCSLRVSQREEKPSRVPSFDLEMKEIYPGYVNLLSSIWS